MMPKHRILVVDDNPAIHKDFQKILTPDLSETKDLDAAESILFGDKPKASSLDEFVVECASQGAEAVELVQAARRSGEPFALAFVDIRMPPGWDGVETVERIWKIDPDVQVVICTAFSDYSWEEMRSRLGVNDKLLMLKKPFDNIEVLQLAHALGQKWKLAGELRRQMQELDQLVASRTAELRVSEERFATAFRSSPIPMAITTIGDRRFVDLNEAFSKLAGAARHKLLGSTAKETMLCMNLQNGTWEAFAASGVVQSVPGHIGMPGGDLREALFSLQKIEVGGQPHALIIAEDITERLRIEKQQRHSQKLEAFGQLAAGIAHDFNNILTVIQGHATIHIGEEGLPPDCATSFEEIEKAASRASDLTQKLLAFSRKQMIRPRVISPNLESEESARILTRLLGEKVRLQLDLKSDCPNISADRSSLEQVVFNLAVNARDAMPEGGQFLVRTALHNVSAGEQAPCPDVLPGQYALLVFADTGVGMDENTRTHAFEPFFTTKSPDKGSGMGLATAYGIVHQHGGAIHVTSTPGEGTVFTIMFPAVFAPVEEEFGLRRVVEQGVEHAQRKTILLVEDDHAVRELVKEMLEQNDYRVVDAPHADGAMEVWPAVRKEIDLLLTDMVMPGKLNGLQLAQTLLHDRPEMPVIYSSGYSRELFTSDVSLVDGVNYLPKPYPFSKLVSTVARALGQSVKNGPL